MIQRKPLAFLALLLILVAVLAAVFSGQGLAASGFVSGTPLLPPVPPGTPLPTDPIITTASFSLLGDSAESLPLQEEFYVALFSSGTGMRKVTANLSYPRDGVPTGHLNVYVEVGIHVSQQVIDALVSEFEKTIRPVVNEYLGTESDIDNNNQITLLITALDAGNISGYFDSRNQYSNKWVANSNEREMIYINSLMLDFGINGVLQTLAHEFTHLVQWNYNWNYAATNVWFTEGIAMYSNYLIGKVTGKTNYWDFSTIDAYLADYDRISLIDWQQRYGDYGAAYAFMIYLAEHYSPGHLRSLFQDPRSDRTESLQEYLAQYGVKPEAVLADWAVANAFNLSGSRYGYADLSLGLSTSRLPTLPGTTFTLPTWMVHYYRLPVSGGKGLAVHLIGQPGLAARLVEKKADGRVAIHELKAAGDGELYWEGYPSSGAEMFLVAANTGEKQPVKVILDSPSPSPEGRLEAVLVPDLLLPGRYTVLVKAETDLDGPPTVEISGMRGGGRLKIAQVFERQGLYVTEPFTSENVGKGPVLILVKGHNGGREITAKQTFQLE
ncbi:MAG: hypothetical protein GX855_03040 [Firmicutes bacterium]|nr:hypothetical protein [Bacillota bacterium]